MTFNDAFSEVVKCYEEHQFPYSNGGRRSRMTYREKILQIFPNARFTMGADGRFPSICLYDLGLLKECGTGMACDTCEECWEMEAEDDE